MNAKALLLTTAATFALSTGIHAAAAQQQPARPQQPQTQQQQTTEQQRTQQQQTQQQRSNDGTASTRRVAENCLADLRTFNNRMNEDGFWLAGWGSGTYGTGTMNRADAAGTAAGTMDRPPAGAARTDTRTAPEAGAQQDRAMQQNNAMRQARAPWTGSGWGISSPPYQIRTLHAAVNVLGHRGEDEACRQVLSELRDIYGDYTNQLRQAGVEPGEVRSWRQERIVASRPVTEITPGLVNLGDVTGTEVRNLQDENLGSVEDLVLDPQSGEIRYVIVSSGGILGIGADMVPVPWNALRATPGMSTFVLDVPEQAIEDAPSVNVSDFSDPNRSGDDRRRVDEYWNGLRQG